MFTPSRRRSHRVSGTVDNEEEFDWESDDEETCEDPEYETEEDGEPE